MPDVLPQPLALSFRPERPSFFLRPSFGRWVAERRNPGLLTTPTLTAVSPAASLQNLYSANLSALCASALSFPSLSSAPSTRHPDDSRRTPTITVRANERDDHSCQLQRGIRVQRSVRKLSSPKPKIRRRRDHRRIVGG